MAWFCLSAPGGIGVSGGDLDERCGYAEMLARDGARRYRAGERLASAGAVVESLWQDIRFGVRLLRKSPGFTLAAVASLGLGIGFNTSIFAVLDAVLLRPLPVAEPHRLVDIYTSGTDGDTYATNSLPDLIDFRAQTQAQVFEDIAGYTPMFTPLAASTGGGGGDRVRIAMGEVGHRELLHPARREGASRTHADARRRHPQRAAPRGHLRAAVAA